MSVLRALTVGAFGITIFLAVLVEGVVVSRADVAYLFRKPGCLVRTILAMNVLGPIVAIIVCRLFDLHPALIVALVTLSMTPVGALFPQGMLGLVRPERGAHAHGLFVATTLLSVVLTPLAIEVINVLYGEDLHAISTKTRKPVWRKNIWKDFGGGAELPRWAIVQNPLIYGDALIVAPQTPEAGVVAYDKLTGALKWKSAALSGIPGYVTPSIVKVAGEDQLVMTTAAVGRGRTARDGSVNGLDPRSGKVLWTYTGWQCIIPVPQAVDAGEGRVLITGAYGAGSVMLKVDKKGDSYAVSELFKNPDFGAHTQPPVLHDGHFYSHYTINERSDGLVAMSMDGQIKWKTDQQPPFVRGGSILADGLLLMTDGNTKLYLVEPSPAGFKPLASAVILEQGDNWAPLALVDGKLLVRGQKELKALQVAR